MDVHNAFLRRDLTEEVFIKLPPRFKTASSNQVCLLRKSLYGLRQTPRYWFFKLSSALKQCGLKHSYADYSLFIYEHLGIFLCVVIYFDNLIITDNDSSAISRFKLHLSSCFYMKDHGFLKYFLGSKWLEIHLDYI